MYLDLFRVPGSVAFCVFGVVGRMPMSMLGIGTVLMLSGITGSYGLAGAVTGTLALSGAIAMPRIARLVDRLGQARVIRPGLAVHVVGMVTLVLSVRLGWPEWTWFVAAAVAGASVPAIGSMVRARWAHVLANPRRRQTAFALESALDEVVFVVGPPLATLLATLVIPEGGLLGALGLVLVGGTAFSLLRSTEPPPHPVARAARADRVLTPPLLLVVTTLVGAGVVFGAIEVAMVAYAAEQGHRSLTGLVLAVYAAGSLIAGLTYGLVRWRRPVRDRYVIAVSVFSMAAVLPLLAPNLLVMGALMFVAGFTIAPALIGGMSLVEEIVPRASLTEGLTWATTGLTVGVTAGAVFSGPLIDEFGAQPALILPAGAAILAAVLAVAMRRKLPVAPPETLTRPVDVPATDS